MVRDKRLGIGTAGSPKAFSSVTIDQSAKAVALGRIGIWPAGRDPCGRGEVFMIVGANPLDSLKNLRDVRYVVADGKVVVDGPAR